MGSHDEGKRREVKGIESLSTFMLRSNYDFEKIENKILGHDVT